MTHDADRRELLAAITRTALLLLVPVSIVAASSHEGLTASAREMLLSVARRLYPHADLGDTPYVAVVDALDAAAADPQLREVVEAGLARLRELTGGSYRDADADTQTRALAAVEGEPFFQVVRQTTAFALYNSPAVWEAFGYGGDAWRFGGYLGRGLADIDWLPHPDADRP